MTSGIVRSFLLRSLEHSVDATVVQNVTVVRQRRDGSMNGAYRDRGHSPARARDILEA